MLNPETPTSDEIGEILEALTDPGDDQSTSSLLENAAIAKFSHYMSDGPGYCGSIYVVVWPGGPEIVDVLTRSKDGSLVANRLPEDMAPDNAWGEDFGFPRADWQYEVRNSDTNLGYWDWVASKQGTEGRKKIYP